MFGISDPTTILEILTLIKNLKNINQAFLFYPDFFEIFSYYCKN